MLRFNNGHRMRDVLKHMPYTRSSINFKPVPYGALCLLILSNAQTEYSPASPNNTRSRYQREKQKLICIRASRRAIITAHALQLLLLRVIRVILCKKCAVCAQLKPSPSHTSVTRVMVTSWWTRCCNEMMYSDGFQTAVKWKGLRFKVEEQ